MAKRRVTIHELRRILKRYGVEEDPSRGQGSHTLFYKQFAEGEFTYPIPTHDKGVNPAYVKGARRKFRLTPADGVSNDDFFGQG